MDETQQGLVDEAKREFAKAWITLKQIHSGGNRDFAEAIWIATMKRSQPTYFPVNEWELCPDPLHQATRRAFGLP